LELNIGKNPAAGLLAARRGHTARTGASPDRRRPGPIARADGPGRLSSSQLELLRAEASRLQRCLAELDEQALAQLQAQAQQMGKEVRAMCADGLREDAQQLAITHAQDAGQRAGTAGAAALRQRRASPA
jgi:hypothetical protein